MQLKIGVGQLLCLVSGVLLLSLGGGLIGGRMAARKHQSAMTGRAQAVAAPAEIAPASEPSPPIFEEPEQAEIDAISAPAALVEVESGGGEAVSGGEPGEEAKVDAPASESPGDAPHPSYAIQAMSTSKRRDANASRKRIMAAGFPAGVFEADLAGKGKWYRVYVGPYETEAEARRALEAVRDIPGFHGSFLKALE